VVEALRLYAAGHEKRLPETLASIVEVPVPEDPGTGRPFEYKRDGDRATLSGPPPIGEQPNVGNVVRYELQIVQ
jgi:hypothetical protein